LSSTQTTPKGSIASAISGTIVQLMREYTGRGPTRARTYIDEDLISVVLQDTLTMGERSLVRDGEVDLVLASRKAFQRTMSRQMIAAVEAHSGRTVLAFLSDNHIDPDVAVESFVLEPRSSPRDADSNGDEGGAEQGGDAEIEGSARIEAGSSSEDRAAQS
jgi:uncharacterized protein YbcI